MWQKAGLIPSRPPVYHRLEKQPHTFTDNFEPPGSLRLRVSGLWGGSSRRATSPRGEHAKNLTQKPPPTDQPFVKGTTLTAVARRTSTLPPNSHVVPVAARWPSANKGATVNLWRERVINLSEGERIKRAHTHGGGSDSSQFMGWSTYSFSHAPAVPPSTVWAATPHGSHREEQHLRVAALSRPAWWWEGTGFVRRRHQR